MSSSDGLLTALRLSDSMLPVGSYTASYGIEQYINEGAVETADELGELVAGYLRGLVGPTELVALGHAHRAAAAGDLAGVIAADNRLKAATVPAEFRDSSTKAGRTLLDLFDEIDEGPLAAADDTGLLDAVTTACEDGRVDGYSPVVLGVVCQQAGVGCREATLVSAYGSVTSLLGAAQRLGRFGHTAVQAQLSSLFPVIESVCDQYYDADLSTMWSFAPLADVRGMCHEHADRRLFMS